MTRDSLSSGAFPRGRGDQGQEADPPDRVLAAHRDGEALARLEPGPAAARERPVDVLAQLRARDGEDLPAGLVVGLEVGRHHAAERVGLRPQDVLVTDVDLDPAPGALRGRQPAQRHDTPPIRVRTSGETFRRRRQRRRTRKA